MSHTEEALQERIKELTCLYEVSSIIVSANVEELDETLKAIANSLKKAFQFPEYTEIAIETLLKLEMQMKTSVSAATLRFSINSMEK